MRKKLLDFGEIPAKDLGGKPEDYEVANERVFRKGGGAGMSLEEAAAKPPPPVGLLVPAPPPSPLEIVMPPAPTAPPVALPPVDVPAAPPLPPPLPPPCAPPLPAPLPPAEHPSTKTAVASPPANPTCNKRRRHSIANHRKHAACLPPQLGAGPRFFGAPVEGTATFVSRRSSRYPRRRTDAASASSGHAMRPR